METYESSVKRLRSPQNSVYALFSDFTNFEKMAAQLPQDKISDLQTDVDTCSFNVPSIGQRITLRIVDREPDKTIKFGGDNSPVQFNAWIQLKTNELGETLMKLTLKIDLPFMIKTMLGGKLKDGIERVADQIANVL